MLKRVVAAFAASALLVSCTDTEATDIPDRTVRTTVTQIPATSVEGFNLPIPFQELDYGDPGWDDALFYADDTYIGSSSDDSTVRFSAVSVHAEELWSVERPAQCSDAVLTEAGSGPLVVLFDSSSEGTCDTASAFRVATGELAWGPVRNPGTYRGPGLVFTRDGVHAALDPETGELAETRGQTVLGEYGGVLVAEADGMVSAHTSGTVIWETAAVLEPPSSVTPRMVNDRYVRVGSGTVLDLESGAIVAGGATDIGVDPTTGTLIVLNDDGLHAYDPGNTLLWSLSVTPETSLYSVGGIYAYIRDGGSIRVHNVLTGQVAQAYLPGMSGTILVPLHTTVRGTALFEESGRFILATVPQHPSVP